MEQAMTVNASLLSEAIVVWTGWGQAPRPIRDEARLVDQFGSDTAADLMPGLRQLEDEFYASDAQFTVADLKEMGDVAADQFRRAHPEISDDAVRALAWCYTYDYK
jgi:hypothetical protein